MKPMSTAVSSWKTSAVTRQREEWREPQARRDPRIGQASGSAGFNAREGLLHIAGSAVSASTALGKTKIVKVKQ